MNVTTIFGLLTCLLCVSSHPISVKIVRDSNILSPHLNSNNIKVKSHASNFSGPSDLLYLVGKCFLYSTDKYEYRVCPFDNVTQHEKVWHSGAYNGVIGVWKEWSVRNNSFDSLIFTDGDDCEDSVQRSAKLVWICGRDVNENSDKVIDIKEPKKCFYEIHFTSDFGCEEHYIYPHMSEEYKERWDRIETNYFYGELTHLGYELALKELFVESGIILNTTHPEINESFESTEKCLKEFVLLREQNVKLEQRIEFLENQLKNKDIK